jgi:hypothetical protein
MRPPTVSASPSRNSPPPQLPARDTSRRTPSNALARPHRRRAGGVRRPEPVPVGGSQRVAGLGCARSLSSGGNPLDCATDIKRASAPLGRVAAPPAPAPRFAFPETGSLPRLPTSEIVGRPEEDVHAL